MTLSYLKCHKSYLLLDFELKIAKKLINVDGMQHHGSNSTHGNKYHSFEYKYGMDNGRNASSSDHENQ